MLDVDSASFIFIYQRARIFPETFLWGARKCAESGFHPLLIFPFYYKELKCVYFWSWMLSWLQDYLDAASCTLRRLLCSVCGGDGGEQPDHPAHHGVGIPWDGFWSREERWELCDHTPTTFINAYKGNPHSLSVPSLSHFCLNHSFPLWFD